MAKRIRNNPAFVQSFYGSPAGAMEAQVTLGQEDTTEMLEKSGDEGEWDGEESEKDAEEEEEENFEVEEAGPLTNI